jgi:hypothetical protein
VPLVLGEQTVFAFHREQLFRFGTSFIQHYRFFFFFFFFRCQRWVQWWVFTGFSRLSLKRFHYARLIRHWLSRSDSSRWAEWIESGAAENRA